MLRLLVYCESLASHPGWHLEDYLTAEQACLLKYSQLCCAPTGLFASCSCDSLCTSFYHSTGSPCAAHLLSQGLSRAFGRRQRRHMIPLQLARSLQKLRLSFKDHRRSCAPQRGWKAPERVCKRRSVL